ncbi:hypothetical protein GCM10009798_40950 [Nocardioides panacihumi]|uniref:Uncharacterized protein n=1 Tax=Nocardioides panacihumi TaxID=400774 RepID=A0ABN2RVB9_9ACTN
MPENTLIRLVVAALTAFALSPLGTAHGSEPFGPTPPQPANTGQGPVFDEGTWTIETMLAARHDQLTATWWESLF